MCSPYHCWSCLNLYIQMFSLFCHPANTWTCKSAPTQTRFPLETYGNMFRLASQSSELQSSSTISSHWSFFRVGWALVRQLGGYWLLKACSSVQFLEFKLLEKNHWACTQWELTVWFIFRWCLSPITFCLVHIQSKQNEGESRVRTYSSYSSKIWTGFISRNAADY